MTDTSSLPENPISKPKDKQVVSAGVSALLVFLVNRIYDGADESGTRQVLAPLAAIVGLVAATVLNAVYVFIGEMWGAHSKTWIFQSGMRKNIREIKAELKGTKDSAQRAILEDELRRSQKLIREYRKKNFTISSEEDRQGQPSESDINSQGGVAEQNNLP